MNTGTPHGKPEQGFLMLADLSGYTSFMARSELDHSHAIVRELLELVTSKLSSLMTLIEIEGDALFVFSPAARISRGETLLELIEATYVSFRDRLATIKRHTGCGCVACNSIHMLDLKFFLHFGEYVPHRIAGAFKLTGSDVNLLHRLTKNRIHETKGWNGYALFTGALTSRMNLQADDFHVSTERYEHLGEVVTHTVDLQQRHRELSERRRVFIAGDEADAVRNRVFPCSPEVLWEWLNDPNKRSRWMEGTTWTELARPGGRTGPGAANHCAHGKGATVEQIVDWRPFEYFSTEVHEGPITIKDTTVLRPEEHATNLSHHFLFEMMLPRFLIRPIANIIVTRVMKLEECWDRLEKLIKEEGVTA